MTLHPISDPNGDDWTIDALCTQVGDDLFFPEKGGSTRTPKAVCGLCPVRARCLEYALEVEADSAHTYRHGIWGGKSPEERYAINKKRRAA